MERFGALAVLETPRDRTEINARLRQRDANLFVEKQLTLENEAVWCIVHKGTEDCPNVTLYEHRDPDGEPFPELTLSILSEVDRRMQRGPIDVRAIDARNKARVRAKVNDLREQSEDIAKDFDKHKRVGSFTFVPRSQQLRMTRSRVRSERADYMRARGKQLEIDMAIAKQQNRIRLARAESGHPL